MLKKNKCVMCRNKRENKYTVFCSSLCAKRFDILLVRVAVSNIIMDIVNDSFKNGVCKTGGKNPPKSKKK